MIAPKVGVPKKQNQGFSDQLLGAIPNKHQICSWWKNLISLGHPDYHIVLKELGA